MKRFKQEHYDRDHSFFSPFSTHHACTRPNELPLYERNERISSKVCVTHMRHDNIDLGSIANERGPPPSLDNESKQLAFSTASQSRSEQPAKVLLILGKNSIGTACRRS